MRNIELNNDKLMELVEKKGELVGRGRKHYEKLEELNNKANDIAVENEAIKVQIREIIGEEMKSVEMSEFETAGSTELKNGKVVVSIVDQLDEFKANMRDQRDRAERKEKGELTQKEIIETKQQELLAKIKEVDSKDLDNTLTKLLAVLK